MTAPQQSEGSKSDREPYNWQRGDTLKSIVEFSIIGGLALKECLVDSYKWASDKLKAVEE